MKTLRVVCSALNWLLIGASVLLLLMFGLAWFAFVFVTPIIILAVILNKSTLYGQAPRGIIAGALLLGHAVYFSGGDRLPQQTALLLYPAPILNLVYYVILFFQQKSPTYLDGK